MKGANLENLPIAGSSEPANPAWLSVKEIVESVSARGVEVTERQLERWREKKLLPPGAQEFEVPGHGGAYKFPPITIDVAVAIRKLQVEKDDLDWIGRQLWWRGFSVDESCWRPMLLETSKTNDRTLRFIAAQVRGEREDNDDTSRDDTLADRVAQQFSSKSNAANIIATRIVRRVAPEKLPYIVSLLLETASGVDPEFELGSEAADEILLIRALDLSNFKRDRSSGEENYNDDILAGESLGFREAIGPMLADIAAGIRNGSLRDAAKASSTELECARDDLLRIMECVPAFYKATKWIYGPKAFGLRFASWVSLKKPENISNIFLLIWVLLRRGSAETISSEKIYGLHAVTIEFAQNLVLLEKISTQYCHVHNWLKPRKLKKAFSDKTSFDEFLKKLRSSNFPVEI